MSKIRVICPPCPRCRESRVLLLSEEGLDRYRGGAIVQDAFPDLSVGEREAFMTGYHDECWELDLSWEHEEGP